MKRNRNRIKIGDEYLSKEIISILAGEKDSEEIKEEWIPLAKALNDPEDLPYLLSEIKDIEANDDLRWALIRAQINSQLKMKEDIDFYKRQLFAAKTIEILLFKRLRLKPLSRERKKKEERRN